jgi:hypothetical protein
MKETQEQYSDRKRREAAAKLPQPNRRPSRNADGRTAQQQESLERRARFAYDHDCD